MSYLRTFTATFTDSAGNELTEAEVWGVADGSVRQMDRSELWAMLRAEWGTAWRIPDDMLRCPCHGLWYDRCGAYAR